MNTVGDPYRGKPDVRFDAGAGGKPEARGRVRCAPGGNPRGRSALTHWTEALTCPLLYPATRRLLGFAGPKREAEEIKTKLRNYLRDELKLELSESKTLITHGRTRFLGYDIRVQHADTKLDSRKRRSAKGSIGLFVPESFIKERSAHYMKKGRSDRRGHLIHDHDFSIVMQYQSEYLGYVNYFLLAQNVHRLGALHWIMRTSLLKTLAAKHKSTVAKMARKYRAKTMTQYGPRNCLQLENPWSPDSVVYRSIDNARPSSSTPRRPHSPRATNSSIAFSPGTVSFASPQVHLKFTTIIGQTETELKKAVSVYVAKVERILRKEQGQWGQLTAELRLESIQARGTHAEHQ